MSTTLVESSDISSLKNAVDNELRRRCHTGSLVGYIKSYPANKPINANSTIYKEHVQYVIDELGAVRSVSYKGYTSIPDNLLLYGMSELTTALNGFTAEPVTTGGQSSCSSSCSGLCTNCTDSCHSSCSNTCTGTCTGSCSSCSGCTGCGGCGGCSGCSGTCSGTCSGGCASCGGACWSGCSTGCTGCSGCGNTCQGSN